MRLTPLSDGFGAQVAGISVRDVITSADAYAQVREAFETHSVLLWRNQDVSSDAQVAFSRAFGPLELTKSGGMGAGTFFARIGNVLPDGSLADDEDRESISNRANQLWHTDSSFKATPALASALAAHQVVSHGGETEFVSTRLAWERLTPALRAEVESLVAVHDYANSRRKVQPDLSSFAETRTMLPVRWRLRWRNPVNGRSALYLASHIGAIEGLSPNASDTLLDELFALATRPEHVYAHRWAPGDLVLWDNRATMHRGRSWEGRMPRLMFRTTTAACEADGLASVRPESLEKAVSA